MKVSLNSIKGLNHRFNCADDIAENGVDQLIKKIGAQLGAIEEIIPLGDAYKGILIVKVISIVDHPDADRLHVCKIDDGGKVKDIDRDDKGFIQVVCGAPNVRDGLLAAWLPPGSTVPESVGKDPFVLSTRKIRGQISNGMLASPKELALNENHEGILEIDGDHAPGTDFAEAFELKDDIVLDIENKMFTHRPDCFGFLGIARELAGIQGLPFKSPDWYVPNPEFPVLENVELPLVFRNELPELVPRFTAVVMSDVHVETSPVWLQVELAKVGIHSINNLVDYSNFFMLETAQPIHIYDYDKVKALDGGNIATLVVRNPKPGEKIKLLNGKEIEPRPEAMMVATETKLICLGGAMGGIETEVDENTKNIIIEAANWDMYEMRRTAMTHGIFTDAVTRFTKGQSPLQNLAVLAKIVNEIRTKPGGKITSQLVDDIHLNPSVLERKSLFVPVTVSADFINNRLGLKLSAEEMKKILENVEFKVSITNSDLSIAAPFWRTDIELREDIVEEIGRLYSFDKLPLDLPKRDISPAPKDPLLELKSKIRSYLSKAGANEVLTYSFVHGGLLDKVGQDKTLAFQLSNALSPELQYFRLSLTPSLLEKIHLNVKAGYGEFAIFELGKVHSISEREEGGLPSEFDNLAVAFTADKKIAALKYSGAAFYEARTYLMDVLSACQGKHNFQLKSLQDADINGLSSISQLVQPYEPKRSAAIYDNDQIVGVVGEYRSRVRSALKLPDYCAGFELFLSVLPLKSDKHYTALPRFPKLEQDICLKVKYSLNYQELYDYINNELSKFVPEKSLFSLSPIDIYQRPDDSENKQITFRLSIANYERTLTDTEVNKLLDEVSSAAKTTYNAERI